MDPITILPQDLHSFILPHSAQALLPFMEVNSKWKIAVKNVLHKYFFSEYVPSGEKLETYPSKYCLGSTRELKERIQQFFEQVKDEKAVFICFFPFNTSLDPNNNEIPDFLTIKWNPLGRTNFYDSNSDGFRALDTIKIIPYVLSQNQLEGEFSCYLKQGFDRTSVYGLENKMSKVALEVCFAVKKLKEQPKFDSREKEKDVWGKDVWVGDTHIEMTIPGCSIMFNVGRKGNFRSHDVRLIKQIKELASSKINRPYRIFLYTIIWFLFSGPLHLFTERYSFLIKLSLLLTISFIFMRIIALVEDRIENFQTRKFFN